MPYFLDLRARSPKEMAPGIRTRTFWKQKMLISVVELEPKSVAAMHTHPEEQVGYVTKGTVEMVIGGEKRQMKAGELYHVPADVPHEAHAGPQGATILDVFSPIRAALQY